VHNFPGVFAVNSRLPLLALTVVTVSNAWNSVFNKTAPAAEVADELSFVGAAGETVSYPQYWQRNAVVIDLQGLSGNGAVSTRPREGTSWPARLILRVRPGSVGSLEVRAAQRVVLPIATSGTEAIDIELAPSVVRSDTPSLTIAWGPMLVPAEDQPAIEQPGKDQASLGS
jgi:hypothetical protein